MTPTDLINWGLTALLWIGIAIAATATTFAGVVLTALAVRTIRHTITGTG